jgi:2-methylcitrate dehydratase PrpD
MTKPLHVGAAASSGLSAARLAALGFTADPDMLDGPLGFVALHRGSEHAPPPVTESSLGLNVKMLPCCYATHEAAEAATSVAASRGPELEGAGVISVDVTVHPGGLAPLIHHRPLDGVQAKFSMEYVVAAALLDGGISFSSFDDRRVDRADVQDLLRRVRVDTADVPPEGAPLWDGRYAVVAVRYSDGTVRSARIDRPLGHVTRPLTEDQLRAKFKDCLRTSVPDAVDAAYTTLRRLRVASSAPQVAESLLALHPTVQEAER